MPSIAEPMLHQATSVAINGRAVMLEGPPGCGKSSLALALIDRGAVLVGDDGVALSREAGRLIAAPPASTANLIEIRNVGLVRFPCTSAPVALLLNIEADAPRYCEQAKTVMIANIAIPRLAFALHGTADPIRVEQALQLFGLPV